MKELKELEHGIFADERGLTLMFNVVNLFDDNNISESMENNCFFANGERGKQGKRYGIYFKTTDLGKGKIAVLNPKKTLVFLNVIWSDFYKDYLFLSKEKFELYKSLGFDSVAVSYFSKSDNSHSFEITILDFSIFSMIDGVLPRFYYSPYSAKDLIPLTEQEKETLNILCTQKISAQ